MMREFMRHANLIWGALGVWLCAIVGVYLASRLRAREFRLLRTQVAKAIFVFFLFDTLLRWRVWWYLRPGSGYEVDWTAPVLMIGATVGMLCLCRILAPPHWGIMGWLAPFVIAAGAVVITAAGFVE